MRMPPGDVYGERRMREIRTSGVMGAGIAG